MRRFYICVILLAAFWSSGCAILAPIIDSAKQAGITEGDRRAGLDKEVKRFHDLLFIGDTDQAMAFFEDDARSKFMLQFKKASKNEKIVDNTVEDIQYQKESHEADVHITVKYYSNTDYLLKERAVVEHWKFHTGGNWGISSYHADDAPKT